MTELRDELPDLNPSSMLDFGSGPGTAALAVWDVWGMKGGTAVNGNGEEGWKGAMSVSGLHDCCTKFAARLLY